MDFGVGEVHQRRNIAYFSGSLVTPTVINLVKQLIYEYLIADKTPHSGAIITTQTSTSRSIYGF